MLRSGSNSSSSSTTKPLSSLHEASRSSQQQEQLQRRPLLSKKASSSSTKKAAAAVTITSSSSVLEDTTATTTTALPTTTMTPTTAFPTTKTTTKRRLRIFGALTGGVSSSSSSHPNHHNRQYYYTKQPTTPPSLSLTTTMNHKRTRSKLTTTTIPAAEVSPSSVPSQYDTRPILPLAAQQDNDDEKDNHDNNNNNNTHNNETEEMPPSSWQESSVTSSSLPNNDTTPSEVVLLEPLRNATTTNTKTTATTATTKSIPILKANQRDVKAQQVHHHQQQQQHRKKAIDPPSRQDLWQQQQQQQLKKLQAVATRTQQEQQQQQQKKQDNNNRHHHTNNDMGDNNSNNKNKNTTSKTKTKTIFRTANTNHTNNHKNDVPSKAETTTPLQPSSQKPRLKSVLRKREMVVEEKKTEETERVVAQVLRQQQQQQAQKQFYNNNNNTANHNNHNHNNTHVDPIKAMLSRPFGRASLPIHVGRNFVVEVSSAEWDAEEEKWKYRILVQQRPKTNSATASASRGSFTTAYTWRSLADFGWLEKALRWEFHGALLVPLLSMAVGVATVSSSTAVPVEAECLRHWLTDVLNGIRGQGEWLYLQSCSPRHETSVLQSEAMETFLYRTGPLTEEQLATFAVFWGAASSRGGGSASSSTTTTLVQRMVKSLEQMSTELCVGPMPHTTSTTPRKTPLRPNVDFTFPKRFRPPNLCMSGALTTAPSWDYMRASDSFGAAATAMEESMRKATGVHEHSIVLMYFLLRNYRETALLTMEKLSLLRPAEEALGVAWKRMAIALTNLFAYEKDVESAKLGELKVKRENMPYRKVQKSHVDDGLRVLSRHKLERNDLALTTVQDFLSALLADLSAVAPSVETFREALSYAQKAHGGRTTTTTRVASSGGASTVASTTAEDSVIDTSPARQRRRPDWLPKAASLLSLHQQRSNSYGEEDEEESSKNHVFQQRFHRNEMALQDALVNLIRHLPIRMARIAWRYWQAEISQVAELHKSAAAVRSKLNVTREDSVSRMLKRHLEEEKEDEMTEILLIQRMLQIGHKEDSIEEPPEVTRKREQALKIAKERLGRWDIKLGLAVMEAIGIQDPNIRVEETTRDLRLVRKYAIGLRECLNRCVEAVGGVRQALLASEAGCRDLREAREKFFATLAQLFSGKIAREDTKSPPWNMLPSTLQRKVGVAPTADPFDWSAVVCPPQQASRNRLTQNSVGGLARECVHAKDKSTDWLLSCMSELLNDYQQRVQQVESFVYMECVGIQLERHFSEKRAAALAAFEKKTDITTAINVARKKKLPKLVDELQRKLDEIGNEVTQTTVREAKELHLESKQLKSDIHDLAVRRLVRARETSTERAVALMLLWSKEEESSAALELKALGEAIAALEKQMGDEDLDVLVEGQGRPQQSMQV